MLLDQDFEKSMELLRSLNASDLTWREFGSALTSSDEGVSKHRNQLVKLWTDDQDVIAKFHVDDLGQRLKSAYFAAEEPWELCEVLLKLNVDNLMVDNIDWWVVFMEACASDIQPSFSLVEWIRHMLRVTSRSIDCGNLNEMVKVHGPSSETLAGVGTLWCELFHENESELIDMIDMFANGDCGFTSLDETHFSQLLTEHASNESVCSHVEACLGSVWSEDEQGASTYTELEW